jgi:tetratricopeptide (TPR) repeat protein
MKTRNFLIAYLSTMLVTASTLTEVAYSAVVDQDLVAKALSLQKKGDCTAALIEFGNAIKKNPYDNVALLDRALLRFENLGDYKGAFDDINECLKINMIDSHALRTRAFFKETLGDTQGALIDYKEALHWYKNDPIALVNRGILYARRGEKKLALADFEKAISINQDMTAQFQRIRLLSDENAKRSSYAKMIKKKPIREYDYLALANVHAYFGNKEKGIATLNILLSKDASYSVAYFNRAVLREELGDHKAALADYDKCIEFKKSNPKAYYNRGILRERMNDREGSMNDLKRALELDPKLQLESAPKPFGLMTG